MVAPAKYFTVTLMLRRDWRSSSVRINLRTTLLFFSFPSLAIASAKESMNSLRFCLSFLAKSMSLRYIKDLSVLQSSMDKSIGLGILQYLESLLIYVDDIFFPIFFRIALFQSSITTLISADSAV